MPESITVQKIETESVILADGTLEVYKPFARINEKLFLVDKGYAVIKDGKVAKSQNGQFEVYNQKSVANKVVEFLRKQQRSLLNQTASTSSPCLKPKTWLTNTLKDKNCPTQ